MLGTERRCFRLTAYTALAFKQAKPFIFVDQRIIDRALDWLMDIQGKNGSFVETGAVIYSQMESRNGNSLALTAFVTIAFIENQVGSSGKYTNTINKGLDYIARNIDEGESTYTIALCSYALQLAKHTSKQSAFNLLDARSKSKDGKKWWAIDTPINETKNPWTKLPRSVDIETTAYALLTFIEANLLDDATPVLNWLLDQQNSMGGFASSHDTVVGLQALYKLVTKLSINTNMQIDFTYKKQESNKFNINRQSAMILQTMPVSVNN